MSRRMRRSSVSVQELRDLLVTPSQGLMAFPSEPYHEVYPGIFVSDVATALSLSLLRDLSVTHVLNAAQGVDNATYWGCYCNMHPAFYSAAGLQILTVPAADAQEVNISVHFAAAAEFIEHALRQNGKVLVHCVQGMSRSPTLVIAFLMIKRGMTVRRALAAVREKRAIFPNYGFLLQLIKLDEQLQDGSWKDSTVTLPMSGSRDVKAGTSRMTSPVAT